MPTAPLMAGHPEDAPRAPDALRLLNALRLASTRVSSGPPSGSRVELMLATLGSADPLLRQAALEACRFQMIGLSSEDRHHIMTSALDHAEREAGDALWGPGLDRLAEAWVPLPPARPATPPRVVEAGEQRLRDRLEQLGAAVADRDLAECTAHFAEASSGALWRVLVARAGRVTAASYQEAEQLTGYAQRQGLLEALLTRADDPTLVHTVAELAARRLTAERPSGRQDMAQLPVDGRALVEYLRTVAGGVPPSVTVALAEVYGPAVLTRVPAELRAAIVMHPETPEAVLAEAAREAAFRDPAEVAAMLVHPMLAGQAPAIVAEHLESRQAGPIARALVQQPTLPPPLLALLIETESDRRGLLGEELVAGLLARPDLPRVQVLALARPRLTDPAVRVALARRRDLHDDPDVASALAGSSSRGVLQALVESARSSAEALAPARALLRVDAPLLLSILEADALVPGVQVPSALLARGLTHPDRAVRVRLTQLLSVLHTGGRLDPTPAPARARATRAAR